MRLFSINLFAVFAALVSQLSFAADDSAAEGDVEAVAVDPSYALEDGAAKPANDDVASAAAEKTPQLIPDESLAVSSGKVTEPEANLSAPSVQPNTATVQGGETTPANVQVAEPAAAVGGDVSDGGRIALEGKGFSIAPPVGWSVRRDMPRTSLFMQVAAPAPGEYPRNIAVIKFPGPELINDVTAAKISQYIVKNFPHASPEIADYDLRNHQSIQMEDGREGILFYTDFSVRGKQMMQAHVLVSSETSHYLISYTDVAEHFENPQGNSEHLAVAWASMTSVELDSPNPQPLEGVQWTAILAIGLMIVGGAVAYVRHRSAGSTYRDYGDMEPGEAAELEPRTNAVENDDSVASDIATPLETNAQVLTFKTNLKGAHSPKKNTALANDEAPRSAIEEEKWNLNAQPENDKATDSLDKDFLPPDQWKVS